jgi:hypothetical protein
MESEIEIMDTDSKGLFEKIKDWSYENWQTLLIILIVLIVGISAYNYNQNNANNSSNSAVVNDNNKSEENSNSNQSNEIADNSSEKNNQEVAAENTDQAEAAKEDGKTDEPAKEEITNIKNKDEGSVLSSSDSGKQYIETAVYGDGITHLARRALDEYIQETGDGANLSKEQKIYAEDYMQNRTGSEKIEIGHQETFSEKLIKEAISNANNLSEKSLQNIAKYIK